MVKRYNNSFREKALQYIEGLPYNVVLRSDLEGLESPRQVSRALKALVEDDVLIKLGYGVYAKTKKNKYLDQPVLQGTFESICMEVLDRLGISWELGTAIKDYNEGRTQQVPVRFIVKIKGRYRGELSNGVQRMVVEKRAYARRSRHLRAD